MGGHWGQLRKFGIDAPIAFGCLVVLLCGSLVGWNLYHEHRLIQDNTDAILRHAAIVAEKEISASLRSIDILLTEIGADSKYLAGLEVERRVELLRARLIGYPELRAVGRSSKSGKVAYSSIGKQAGFDISKRAYFQVAKTGSPARSYLTGPTKVRDGSIRYFFSRQVLDEHGEFDGVVVTSFAAAFFDDVLRSIRPRGRYIAVLTGTDGVIAARLPGPAAQYRTKSVAQAPVFRAHLESGEKISRHRAMAPIEGVERYVNLLSFDDYPLIVVMGRDYEDIFAAWQTTLITRSLLLVAIILISSALVWLARRREQRHNQLLVRINAQAKRESQLAEDLRQANAGLEITVDDRTRDLRHEIAEHKQTEAALRRAHDEMETRVQRRTKELRDSENRFRDMAEVSADWFWEIDQDLRYTYVSPGIANIGLEPEFFIGKTFMETLGDDYIPGGQDEMVSALMARRPYRGLERPSVVTGKWVRTNAKPLFSDDGAFLGYRGTTSDISEHKLREEQLRQAQKMEAIGQLTGGVAHDFNNLLAVIIGNAEFIQNDIKAAGPVREAPVRTITRAANRGAELTSRLLAFSRKQVLEPQVIDLPQLLAGTMDILRRTLGETIEIKTIEAPRIWPCEADPGQLENALLNLAINARDAMPQGGVLSMEAANVDLGEDDTSADVGLRPGSYVMLAVKDTGTGMTGNALEHAFEPFFTTKDVGQGSGLGLSMVFGFAKQSGGHVSIESELGTGTTVRLYLPRASQGQTTEDAAPGPEPAVARNERILVVEDDAEVRLLAVTLLQSLGYHVLQAADGPAALALMRQDRQFDLLLTDVILPSGLSGPDIAAQAGKIIPDIKVLFMSGYADNEIVRHGSPDGDVILLQKPFTGKQLAAKLRTILDSRT